jgi:hypothetical protein
MGSRRVAAFGLRLGRGEKRAWRILAGFMTVFTWMGFEGIDDY